MACKYILDGHEFKSELALDDFLLEKGDVYTKYGDIVFSMSSHQSAALRLLEIASKENEQVKKSRTKRVFDEMNGVWEMKAPYIGVNKFLSQYYENGLRLFPNFEEDNYWANRRDAWIKGDFTDDEIELFGSDLKITAPTLKELEKKLDNLQNMIENKWERQCLIGDAVHSVFLLYFSKFDKVKMWKDVLTDDTFTEFKGELNKLTYTRRDKSKIGFNKLIDSDLLLKNVIELCKTLDENLKARFGDSLAYFPEFELTARMTLKASNGADTLSGVIDLLIIDKNGTAHIIDYKTSPKNISKYHLAKLTAYTYQVGTYGRMLAKAGFNIEDTLYLVVPMLLLNFKRLDYDKFSFDSVKLMDDVFQDLTTKVNTHLRLTKVLDDLIDLPVNDAGSVDELSQRVTEVMGKWFPHALNKVLTDEQIRAEMEEAGAFKMDEERGLYVFHPKDANYEEVAKTESELFEKVKRRKNWFKNQTQRYIKETKKALKEGIEKNTSNVDFILSKLKSEDGISQNWFKLKMSKYCNNLWEVVDDVRIKPLEQFGIIVLHNKYSRMFDFVKISMQNPYYTHNLDRIKTVDGKTRYERNKTTSLGGAFKNDLYFKSNSHDLMLDACNGNIESIEVMLVINNMVNAFGDNSLVGNILVANPVDGYGILVSNKQLLYSFNLLDSLSEIPTGNNFKSNNGQKPKIQMASKAHIAKLMFDQIMKYGSDYTKYKTFRTGDSGERFRECQNMLDLAIDNSIESKLFALEELRKTFEYDESIGNDVANLTTNPEILAQDHMAVYTLILLAIAELKGIDFKQQLRDHSKWCESLAIHKKGLLGTYIDNPGNLSSETLNMLTKLTTEAYQNVRQDLQQPILTILEYVENLKKEKGFNKFIEHTYGNQADLYKNLYDFSDGDIKFKRLNDPSLSSAEKNILEYALDRINSKRYPHDDWRNSNDDKYYRCPLAKGDTSSFASRKGLLNALKDRLNDWNPKHAFKRAKEKMEGFFNEEYDLYADNNKVRLFEMTNMFDLGETLEQRLDLIARKGVEYFEANLETLLLKYEFAYSSQERIDTIMPMLKAAMAHLSMEGFMVNKPFENDTKYVEAYIKNKIRNESIIPKEYLELAGVLNTVRAAASKMVLAFSPVQALYQTLQAIWNDIGLIIRNPDGRETFTLANMLQAGKYVYRDLFDWSGKPTLVQRLNELYGINDMDMNTYIDRIKSDTHGIHNMTTLMFKFASRPDYYSRMTIIVAKMINDGSFAAHSINEKGELIYDFKKDGRFSAFLNNDKSDINKYNDQRALYVAIAKQFEAEGATVTINGELVPFKLNLANPMPLPLAYTNKEMESIKSVADTLYGYYAHEKKSMIQSTLFGSMWMQFKTYWSGKKNQYLAGGGVKLEGHWEIYSENGQEYYYPLDSDGNVLWYGEPTTENTGYPIYVWKGDWKEGILATLMMFGRESINNGVSSAVDELWYNLDESLLAAYRDNMKHLAYDLVMWGIIGSIISAGMTDWYKDEKENTVPGDVADGLRLAAVNIAVKSVTNSFLDFNFLETVGAPGYQWTPFAFEYLGNQIKNVYSTLLNEKKSVVDMIINSNSALRQTKPFWSALTYSE